MDVSTGQFQALTAAAERLADVELRLAALEARAEVDGSELVKLFQIALDTGRESGRASVLGRRETPPPSRPRHLLAVRNEP